MVLQVFYNFATFAVLLHFVVVLYYTFAYLYGSFAAPFRHNETN